MTTRSLRILALIEWADAEAPVVRLWDGGGPWMDGDGEVWMGAGAFGSLDEIEMAINGEAAALSLTLSGVAKETSDLAWLSYTNDQIIGSTVTVFIQTCDASDQPVGEPETRFAGVIDDISFRDTVSDDRPMSTIEVPVANLFTVRRLRSGAVLSDADQRARSAVLNPGAEPDRFCERTPLLQDKSVVWPRWM